MRKVALIVWMLLFGLGQIAVAEDRPADGSTKEEKKGLTVEDVARGLKSAAQNIEKEIPKIGSAIGEAVKKITGKDSEKQKSESPSKEGK